MIPKKIHGKYLLKKIAKLIGCFFLWSFFYATQGLVIRFILNKTVTPEDFNNAIQEFLFGHYHQWFLLMLAGIYLLLPFIQKICIDNKLMQYFSLLWLICNIIIPLFPVNDFTSQFQIHFATGYIGYFTLGYYLSQCHIDKKCRICLYIAGLISTGYTVLATIADSRSSGTYVKIHYDSFSWNVFLMAVSIFVFFLYKKEKADSCKKYFPIWQKPL